MFALATYATKIGATRTGSNGIGWSLVDVCFLKSECLLKSEHQRNLPGFSMIRTFDRALRPEANT